jgi:hypothetical protein
MGKKILFCLVGLLCLFSLEGQNEIRIKGLVTDSVSGEPLPYVSIIVKGTTTGAATDLDGRFSLTVPSSASGKMLEVSYLGYSTKQVPLKSGQNLSIQLAPTGIALNEVVVKPGRERYRRRDNPAVAFVKNVIERRNANDPRNHDYYSYDRYQKMVFAMNDYKPKKREDGKTGKFDFLEEFIDTLDVGTTILPISEKEHFETVYYRRDPHSEKRLVKGDKSAGVDEVFSRDGIQQFLNEAFREVDIFRNNIPLFLQRFVSPLSSLGPTFYKYYLMDTLEIDGQKCMDLGFVPFNSESFGFTGHLYVTLDSTYFVRRVLLNVPKDINLNFVSHMTIDQTFRREPDGTRLITKDDIRVNFKLSEKSKGMFAQRLIVYSNHSFEPDTAQLAIFEQPAPSITLKEAYTQTDKFWEENRPQEGRRRNPNTVDKLMAKLRSIPIFYITEKIVTILVSGYVPATKDEANNKFEFGPMNTTISGNAIEGARFRVGGTTTPQFHKRLTLDGFAAYGVRDKKMKYDALVEYSFIDRKQYRKEFPMHSIRFEYMYDINKLGQQYMYTSKDNFLLAIRRKRDTRATYLRKAELTYTREHYNGISYSAVLRNKREYATPYAVFDRINADGSLTSLDHYDMTELELNFRYGYNEKFYQTRNNRIPITFDAWVFNLSHVMGWKGFLGSSYNYQRTDIGLQKRLWFSAFGYTDIILKAGKVWTKVPYPLLILPNANLSYTIQPEAYTNMNAMEFINDEYASWDVTYYMNGLLLNRIPLIKKLKWREVFCFRGLWGHLSDKNNPAKSTGLFAFPEGSMTLGKAPYMEASVGIENIFKFLRLDYVWRLNYRDNPDIQTHGVRCTMRIQF